MGEKTENRKIEKEELQKKLLLRTNFPLSPTPCYKKNYKNTTYLKVEINSFFSQEVKKTHMQKQAFFFQAYRLVSKGFLWYILGRKINEK